MLLRAGAHNHTIFDFDAEGLGLAVMVGTTALAQAGNYKLLHCGSNEPPRLGEIQKILNGAAELLHAQSGFVPNTPEGYTRFLRDEVFLRLASDWVSNPALAAVTWPFAKVYSLA